ncbi:phosphoribosylanthranilate isomerase [bacterium]|nr:phosphoribosylanthranilate isomerase [bacterium]NCQ54812.1 phosphoribosylanthranilate isomerase [Candidatus Parcubacteria bacterium]NCS66856.1 phosphoribosylanthranilate isomerase [Candidatus Peregrinibacteria bacterium]NCS95802.1 phosphoribosylanthranilate isomerase [bacterium]
MHLKVCGVRTMPMAQSCQDLSVPYVGFNFVPTSKRYIAPISAQNLSHAYTGQKVGVFQNETLEKIFETCQLVDLDIIQLHGQETPEMIETLKNELKKIKPFKIWKAFSVDESFDFRQLQQYGKNCDLFLFDGANPGSGTQIVNTSTLHDAISETQKLSIPFALAGGINPNTAAKSLDLFPTATLFDTASGVETNQEFKAEKLKQLLEILKDE